MPDISEAFVDSAAPNASAIKNGKGLVIKKKLIKLRKSADDTLIFAECKGSGKSNYFPSADFLDPDSPVYRCTCPSRQFPCKHVMGLMYAYVQGETFNEDEIPEDIASKRSKIEKRAENKKKAANKPVKVNKAALEKKIKAQLDGLDLLEKLTNDLVRSGLGNLSPKTVTTIEKQAEQLGNSFIPGAQNALRALTLLFYDPDQWDEKQNETEARREKIYSEALDRLARLQAIVKKGRQYLNSRLTDPDLKPDIETDIAAWLGHAWQLRELQELDQVEKDAELLQLAFNTYDDKVRQEYVDQGWWCNLKTGAVDCTFNYRPYKASQFIKEEDCYFEVAKVPELYLYPGDMNRRIRWEKNQRRAVKAADYGKVKSLAEPNLETLIKLVKNQLKAPLGNKHPSALLRFRTIGVLDKELVLEDHNDQRIILENFTVNNEPATCHLLRALPAETVNDQAILLRFRHDLDTRRLTAKPVSIVTDKDIIRLEF